MKLDNLGRDFILLHITNETYDKFFDEISELEILVSNTLRVIIQDNKITQNMFNALVSIALSIDKETFVNSNLVKYIKNTININNITIKDDLTFKAVNQFVKSGIAYWILSMGKDSQEIIRRKAEIKLYFS